MEYRKHCDDGRANVHDVYWHPPEDTQATSLLSPMLSNEDMTLLSSTYGPSRHAVIQRPSVAVSTFRLDYTSPAQFDRLNSENQRLTRQVEGLQADNQGLRDDNNVLRMDRDIARAERDTLRAQLHHVTTQFADHPARHTPSGVGVQTPEWMNPAVGDPASEANYFMSQALGAGVLSSDSRSMQDASPAVNIATAMLHPSAPTSTPFDFSLRTMKSTDFTTAATLEDPFIANGTVNPSAIHRPPLQRPQTGGSARSETDATLVNPDDTSWTDNSRNRAKLPLQSSYVPRPNDTLGWGR